MRYINHYHYATYKNVKPKRNRKTKRKLEIEIEKLEKLESENLKTEKKELA